MQELITKKDTLELFNIVPSTIWHWQKKGKLNSIKKGRQIFYDRNEVFDILESKNKIVNPAGSLTTHNMKIKDLSLECVDMGLTIRQSLNLIEEVMARYFK